LANPALSNDPLEMNGTVDMAEVMEMNRTLE
jgi:hypothetical protein